MYAQDSIDLLHKAGIQFKLHEQIGISQSYFAELLITSGLCLLKDVHWIGFHSGYDFGYLLKMLTNKRLPDEENLFFDDLTDYFHKIYDVKYLMVPCEPLKGGLQEVADQLEVQRIGQQHQAGSDSLLTGKTFFKIQKNYFNNSSNELRERSGFLFGLGGQSGTNANAYNNEDYNTEN